MREIKFRAWGMNKMHTKLDFSGYDELNDVFANADRLGALIMQYTGLKDKNGVEIYEGDVVTHSYDTQLPTKNIVKWIEDYACFAFVDYGYSDGQNHYYQRIDEDRLEVIGNIYENPELL